MTFDTHEWNNNLLFGILSLALEVAIRYEVPFNINAEQPPYAEILQRSMQDLSSAAADPTNEIPEIAKNARHISDADICKVAGVVLVVGVGASKLQILRGAREATVFIAPTSSVELAQVVEAFPEASRAHLRSGSAALTLSASQLEGKGWFDERYDVVAHGTMNPQSDLVELGKGEPRVCRYCIRSTPEVTFDEFAHAFPEQTGNKKLVDRRECDCCNKRFGQTIDDDFSKWSLPSRSVGRIIGKRSVPTFKASDHKVRVEHGDGNLQISVQHGDQRVILYQAAKSLTMKHDRQPYTPMGVFKCFVKMALAVMPESEAGPCRHLTNWIREEKHTLESFQFKPLMLLTQSISGPLPNNIISYFLLRRKPNVDTVLQVKSFSRPRQGYRAAGA